VTCGGFYDWLVNKSTREIVEMGSGGTNGSCAAAFRQALSQWMLARIGVPSTGF
jgi:hypothetical protein